MNGSGDSVGLSGDEKGGDPMSKAAEVVNELYQVRDTFFPLNTEEKMSKLRTLSDHAIKLLDSIPLDHKKSVPQRASFEYLRGKTLDIFPEYCKEAEDHLSKAVKLNSSYDDAWLCLGNCIWKKGDLSSAKNCFSLALRKGPNKHILCQLSMLERQLARGTENQAHSIEQSIQHAREAIMLDVKDGNSWYNFGNACLTSFFVSGAWDKSILLQSIKAYQNAEKDVKMKYNPDLFFNCAIANKYIENYKRALTGFEAASMKDPGLKANEEVQSIINLFDKLANLIKREAKAKHLAEIAYSLNEVGLNTSHKKTTIAALSKGLNVAAAIVGKVLRYVKHETTSPLYYVICDSDQTCFALSVYGLDSNAIKEGDQVILPDPCFGMIDFSWKGRSYKFSTIRVDLMNQILINGKPPASQHTFRTSIHVQHKP